MFTRLQNWQDAALCLVRAVTGYMFLQHGLAKFFEFPVSMTDGHGAVPLFSLFGAGGMLELAGGALLILGVFAVGSNGGGVFLYPRRQCAAADDQRRRIGGVVFADVLAAGVYGRR